jgi:hypothetical protein
VLAEALVMRLNPEVGQPIGAILLGLLLWASWGVVIAGLPIVLLQWLLRSLRRKPSAWPAPGLTALVYVVAGILGAVNADLHEHLLSSTARRVLLQDAVAWGLGALLALILGSVIRRVDAGRRWKIAFAVVMLVLPAIRLVIRPTTVAAPLAVPVEAIGAPNRPLIVVGIEGLDIPVLLTYVRGGHAPLLDRVMREGAWGSLKPYEPFLRQSYWTSAATGTYPGTHGVKSHWGWSLPWLDDTLRLLPWTPQGSRLILPWWLADRVRPPASTVAPLWGRLRASGVSTEVIKWPGFWPTEPRRPAPGTDPVVDDPALLAAVTTSLAEFPARSGEVDRAIARDRAALRAAIDSLEAGVDTMWLHLEALAATRRNLEPLKPRHTRERATVELVVELVDAQLAHLAASAPPDALIVLVSPYGLSPPSSYERLRRLVGVGGDWRSSGDRCWDGVMMILGRDVVAGRRFSDRALPQVVPTVCYLLGLPVAQYMEGEIIIEAIDPAFLETHPLVVD